MKSFEHDGLKYSKAQNVNGGEQWKCTFLDGQYSLAMIYKRRATRADVIEAHKLVNAAHNAT